MTQAAILRWIDRLHRIYLALLPIGATAFLILTYGSSAPYLVFFVGIAAVGIYQAVIAHYTSYPRSILMGLILLLDGPLWVLISAWSGRDSSSIFVEAFLVDGLAIYLSILFLSFTSDKPTKDQRRASIGIALATSGLVLWMCWPYLAQHVFPNLLRGLLLAGGCIQATLWRYKAFRDEEIHREEENPALLGGSVLLWCLVLFLSFALHQKQ